MRREKSIADRIEPTSQKGQDSRILAFPCSPLVGAILSAMLLPTG
jgi:hypothetical protein